MIVTELDALIAEQEKDARWGHIADRLPFVLPLGLWEIDHMTRAQARPRRPRFLSGRCVKRIKKSSEVAHGDEAMYLRGCRCEPCEAGRREATASRRRAKGIFPRPSPRHGTISGYQKLKCRCEACRVAWNDYMRAHRSRSVRAERATSPSRCVVCLDVRGEAPVGRARGEA